MPRPWLDRQARCVGRNLPQTQIQLCWLVDALPLLLDLTPSVALVSLPNVGDTLHATIPIGRVRSVQDIPGYRQMPFIDLSTRLVPTGRSAVCWCIGRQPAAESGPCALIYGPNSHFHRVGQSSTCKPQPNRRLSSSATANGEVIARGWISESVAMCAWQGFKQNGLVAPYRVCGMARSRKP